MCCSGSGAIRARAEPPSRYSCACAHRPALQHRARTHARSLTRNAQARTGAALRCAARRRTRAPSRRARTAAAKARSRRARMPSSVRVARHRWPRVSLARRAPSAPADEARVAWLPGRPTFVCSASTARGTEVRHVASEGSRVRALAARPLRLAALHVGIGRFYAGCMVFPPRASCAAPGVVDDFDPMEGSCKIRRFRRGCPTSAPGLALGCAHVCDAAGLCASV